MGKIASRRPLLLRSRWAFAAIAATLGCCLTCMLLLAAPVHALDPNKRLTQYLHTSWRIQDGSLPAGMFSITQTSDGFLWFSAIAQGVYRFDGVRFVPWVPPAKIASIHVDNVYADHAGGLWAIGDHEIVHIRDGAIIAYFDLEGIGGSPGISRDPDGSLWITRASNRVPDAPLCHITDRAVEVFRKVRWNADLPGQCPAGRWRGGFLGWEDRRPLSTGVPASRRCIPLRGSNPTQGTSGSIAWPWGRWIALDRNSCRRARTGTWTIERRRL